MLVRDLDYTLPPELIADQPAETRDASRLLVVSQGAPPAHHRFADLVSLATPSLIVFNDTKVIPARLLGNRPTGAKVEILLLEPEASAGPGCWRALGRANKPLKPGHRVVFGDGALEAEVVARHDEGQLCVRLEAEGPLEAAIEAHGEMPLPPYIKRPAGEADRTRYQTVYAEHAGAVAAPTAGLHFTKELLDALEAAGHRLARVTLHVGLGTFRPVKVDDLDAHPMHAERYHVPDTTADAIAAAKAEGRPVLAVGTTVVRTLEGAATEDGVVPAGSGRTNLLIQPGYRFRVIDALLTNFHLPKSTLLALVMAFAGEEPVREAYRVAVEERYRFFSYGDAMYLPERKA